MSNVTEFTDSNFQSEVLDSDVPVLVDFWAPWCGPCRQIAPMIDELASDNGETVKIGKMNVDESPSTPQTYRVSSIPTIILFKGGEIVDTFIGVQPKARLQQSIDTAKA